MSPPPMVFLELKRFKWLPRVLVSIQNNHEKLVLLPLIILEVNPIFKLFITSNSSPFSVNLFSSLGSSNSSYSWFSSIVWIFPRERLLWRSENVSGNSVLQTGYTCRRIKSDETIRLAWRDWRKLAKAKAKAKELIRWKLLGTSFSRSTLWVEPHQMNETYFIMWRTTFLYRASNWESVKKFWIHLRTPNLCEAAIQKETRDPSKKGSWKKLHQEY